jgi:hypothetical protein
MNGKSRQIKRVLHEIRMKYVPKKQKRCCKKSIKGARKYAINMLKMQEMHIIYAS